MTATRLGGYTMFHRTKKQENQLSIYCDKTLVFQGNLYQLPLRETVIIEKSIHFFNDHEPCYIHRSAVQIRLIAEIENQLQIGFSTPDQCPLLKSYSNFDAFSTISYHIVE
jgi:hypothetical protein